METAYHEAGHAMMAYHVGASVEQLTVDPESDDGPKRFGDVRIRWDDDWRVTRQGRQRALMVILSGPVAEMVYRDEPLHPGFVPEWSDDWNQAWEVAAELFPDERSRLRYLEGVCGELLRFFRNDANWTILATLADELDAHETLEEEMVVDILGTWIVDR